ncbi:hypothetical protein [Roseofilum sp. Guam]|uniref:hypothetical protein n=1 Tax=Roseofilum sp. Guam TaxID=2821502 RepID=UPI001B053CCB|nr:hypothetical protein [Roseofilum sp. Guam]MBP0031388.1 hypothetical protein [Roseofilum sp. Guam]
MITKGMVSQEAAAHRSPIAIFSYSVTVLLIDSGTSGSSLIWSGLSLHEKIPEPPDTNSESAPEGCTEALS